MKGISNAHRARHISAKIHQNYLINSISYIEPVKTYDEKRGDKYVCACGGKYSHTHRSTHSKTKRHQDYLINQSNRSNGSLSTEFKKE